MVPYHDFSGQGIRGGDERIDRGLRIVASRNTLRAAANGYDSNGVSRITVPQEAINRIVAPIISEGVQFGAVAAQTRQRYCGREKD